MSASIEDQFGGGVGQSYTNNMIPVHNTNITCVNHFFDNTDNKINIDINAKNYRLNTIMNVDVKTSINYSDTVIIQDDSPYLNHCSDNSTCWFALVFRDKTEIALLHCTPYFRRFVLPTITSSENEDGSICQYYVISYDKLKTDDVYKSGDMSAIIWIDTGHVFKDIYDHYASKYLSRFRAARYDSDKANIIKQIETDIKNDYGENSDIPQ